MLSYSTEESLEHKLDWLLQRLALDEESLSKLVQGLPQVLSLSIIEESLEPTLVWLQERLVLDDESLSKLVQNQPWLLLVRVSKKTSHQH